MTKKLSIKDITYISLFAALISVSGYLAFPLPFSPVPVTAQTLVIMLAGSILTPLQAGLSVLVFLLLGAVGVPVFSNGSAGLGVLFGPTGGFLIGFLAAAVVIAWLKGKSNNMVRLAAANIVGGIIVVYLFGIPWLMFMTHMSLGKALTVGALPFIPGDLFKAFAAVLIGYKLRQRLG